MNHYRMPTWLRRWLAGIVAMLIGLGPLAAPAYAGLTPLGDQPLNIQNSSQPNIVLTVDDSTSMLFDFLPDYVVGHYDYSTGKPIAVDTFCRGGLGSATALCGSVGAAGDFTLIGGGKYYSPGYTFQQYNYPYTFTGSAGGVYGPSGPGSGCFSGVSPICAGGVDPGALPGISTYASAPATWPNAGKPYEYWLLWPAPAHNAAMNAIYYDPRITYDPPVDSTGTSYDQMDGGHTSNWTSVPADPWASSIVYVDLTKTVNIGMWCNTDWSLGLVTTDTKDPNYGKYCRVNGSGAPAFGTVTAPEGADYTYPWAPPAFTLSASPGAATSNTYAGQKVTLNGTLTGTAINAAKWNASSQDPRYFYQNENVIWCDPTSPSWPQTGTPQTQTCGNLQSQTCSALAQTCNKTPGSCNNYVAPSCNGLGTGTCNGWQTAGCNGTAGSCNNPPACTFGNCNNPKGQVCVGTGQSCNNISNQTCSGPLPQTCNLPGTQTCTTNIVYDPPGCNLLPPDPENPCTPSSQSTCTPDPGHCSIQTGKSCTQDLDCTPQPGLCNLTLTSCMQASDCPQEGHCSTDSKLCTQASDCAIIGGTCNRTPQKTCTKDSDCPSAGNCSNNGALFCLSAADCGQCNNPAGLTCTSVAQCTQGNCNQKTCPNGTTVCNTSADCGGSACNVKSCASNANCPTVQGGTCVQGGALCGNSAQCPTTPGKCSDYCADGTTFCTSNGQCGGIGNGKCGQNPPVGGPGKSCSGATQALADAVCTRAGTCSVGGASCNANVLGTPPNGCPEQMGTCAKDASVQCRTSSDCSSIGTCSFTSAACNSQVPCNNIPGQCSITLLGCSTPGVDLVNCPQVGKCSITQAACTTSCPSLAGPLPPSAATCTTADVGSVGSGITLRHDAETTGVVCRRNNQTSATASYSSGAYDYPSGKFLTPITNGTGADACPATDHYASVPRHYWKSEVQWCDRQIANTPTTSDQWAGYGTDSGGTCQAGKDSTHIYPRFFQFGAASYVDNYKTAAFQRVDLDIGNSGATYTHNWIDVHGQSQSITRTFDEEMTNYANWFAYYHTRIQAVKTVTSLSFAVLDKTYRVGFHTLSNGDSKTTIPKGSSDPATFVPINNFDDSFSNQKTKWFTQLFAISIPLGLETPTLNAMARIGEYFSPSGSSELVGAGDPIILSCQKNWHMLFTDGFTNQGKPGTLVGDKDDTVPALPDPVAGLTTGAAWPPPFRENSSQLLADGASDYAMNYWAIDLRPAASYPPNVSDDNVPATAKDPATWQHLNFAALSLGTQGKLPVAQQSLTESLLASGALQWPVITPNCTTCTVANQPDNSGVDDLWHAAINGRGRFVNAQTATELKLGMGQILEDITNQAGARAGAGFTSGSISVSNHAVYIVTFQPGWAGTLSKVELDTTTGAQTSTDWEAATQLSNQLTIAVSDPTCTAPGSCPWFTNRKIFTVKDDSNGNPGSAVPFLWGSLSATQQDSFAPGTPAVGQSILAFLRGDPTNEGVGAGQFRVRGTGPNNKEDFLGDIVDSQAVYVGPPDHPFSDGTDPGYSGFVTTWASRPPRVYVGANDGMLHAFRDVDEVSGVGGSEAWAFVPHDLYRPDATGLGALSYQDGGLPAFKHHYYVDSTPRVYDANFGGGSTDWHTLLIGGLGKGGKSYYALDVTDPNSVTDENKAAAQYLWTFTDPDMGYTYGRPFVTKTHANKGNFYDGEWVVVVAAGYNNVDTGCVDCGQGKIFFIDAKTGAKLKDLSTGVGDSNNPAGLAHVIGYTKDYHNQVVEQIYGGDLLGNFWRFDVSDPDPANWDAKVVKIAELKDPSNNPQPVTTPPTTDVDIINGVDRWVFVGTGRLLASSDLTDPLIANQQQTLYAIRDGTATSPATFATPLQRTDLVPLTPAEKISGLSTKPAKGWYDDLPAGQRIITAPEAALSLVAYAGTSAQDNPCLTGEPATLYVRSFSTAEDLIPATATGYNPVTGGVDEGAGAVGLEVTVFTDSGNSKSAGSPDIRIAITTAAGTIIFQSTLTQVGLATSRMSWRLFGQ